MGEEIDILMAQMFRKNADQPWGFRIEGGYNNKQPLTISLVAPDSPAALIGLQAGDVITKIFSRPTKFLTYNQAADIIGSIKSNDLILTIERKASGCPPFQQHQQSTFEQPKYYNQDQQKQEDHHQEHIYHSYQPLQPTFKGSARIQLSTSPGSSSPNFSNQPQHYHDNARYLTSPRIQTPTLSQAKPVMYKNTADDDNDDGYSSGTIPQSRTFMRLQNFMENKHPALGADGLPPPRSASMEQQKINRQGQGRVKVIMSQKYNSPLKLYSAQNVVDTFTNQAESILESMEN